MHSQETTFVVKIPRTRKMQVIVKLLIRTLN